MSQLWPYLMALCVRCRRLLSFLARSFLATIENPSAFFFARSREKLNTARHEVLRQIDQAAVASAVVHHACMLVLLFF